MPATPPPQPGLSNLRAAASGGPSRTGLPPRLGYLGTKPGRGCKAEETLGLALLDAPGDPGAGDLGSQETIRVPASKGTRPFSCLGMLPLSGLPEKTRPCSEPSAAGRARERV